MTEFVIKMADERGRVQEQTLAANTADELRSRFTQAGFYVYSVKTRGMAAGKGKKKKAKLETFLIFNQQFVTLIRAGLPILGSIELLAKQQRNPLFRAQLEDVGIRVRTGESLSQAFEAQGGFPVIYTTTLLAGERSGNLEEVLTRYLAFQRVALTFRKKLIASLIYPSLLIVMVVTLFFFLITFVVPQFAKLYEQIGSQLPELTVLLLAMGGYAQKYYMYYLPAIALLAWVAWHWANTDKGAARLDRALLAFPFLGTIWLKYQVALFARTLATLLTGGLPLVPSLETAARSIGSSQIANAVFGSVESVREGMGLGKSLQKTGVFPDLSVEMIEVGESTGALPTMLNSVAEFFEEDTQTSLSTAMSLIEPIILVFMGIIVAVILIALYLPIFSMSANGMNQGH